MTGLANMLLFLILVNYVATLVSVQLFRGDIAGSEPNNFGQLWNAFLTIYQVFSSENWTNVLYTTGQAEIQLGQVVIAALFVVMWLLFANCEAIFWDESIQLIIGQSHHLADVYCCYKREL